MNSVQAQAVVASADGQWEGSQGDPGWASLPQKIGGCHGFTNEDGGFYNQNGEMMGYITLYNQ
jgi:hypothetical protein